MYETKVSFEKIIHVSNSHVFCFPASTRRITTISLNLSGKTILVYLFFSFHDIKGKELWTKYPRTRASGSEVR